MNKLKFNARDVYHFICNQPMGARMTDVMNNFDMDRTTITKIVSLLINMGLIKFKAIPTNFGRQLTRIEIDKLESFTGE